MNRSILISAKVVVLILSFPLLLVTYAQEQTQVQECELGENREFAIGHNFWKAMVGKEKTLGYPLKVNIRLVFLLKESTGHEQISLL